MMLTADTQIHNRYRVVRHLAGGGMGHIYEAIDERFNSTVALKQMTLRHCLASPTTSARTWVSSWSWILFLVRI